MLKASPMRKTLLTIATVGLLGLSTMSGAFAQQLTPAEARVLVYTNCVGTQTAGCQAALQVLAQAVTVANGGVVSPSVAALIREELASVLTEVRSRNAAAGVSNAAIATTFNSAFAASVPAAARAELASFS